jgi:hypothetical protein
VRLVECGEIARCGGEGFISHRIFVVVDLEGPGALFAPLFGTTTHSTGSGQAARVPLLFCVNNPTTDNRHFAARFQNLRRGNFHDVGREDGEVGKLADFD